MDELNVCFVALVFLYTSFPEQPGLRPDSGNLRSGRLRCFSPTNTWTQEPERERRGPENGGWKWSRERPESRLGRCAGVKPGPSLSRSYKHDGVNSRTIDLVHREQETPQQHRPALDQVAEDMWVSEPSSACSRSARRASHCSFTLAVELV